MSSELFVCVAVEVYIAAARAWLQTIALYKKFCGGFGGDAAFCQLQLKFNGYAHAVLLSNMCHVL